ncbi:alpha/beta-hydrolase [Trematosphaeria pertusa]|uniref:Alpha/beta-hydrolase n=1 Tax=Trematosphaeria pertusa TaxID=390896 RepID=A0A6A6IVY8_9PLEO|nr:alpha/beta-hydrolase [Trematosphaeria pertusa]KAF2254599.1 alpha/beta-hydrolase [Trematosphaeria pertusa]
MVSLHPMLKKSYWLLAALGGLYAVFMLGLLNAWFQRHALYMHKIHSGFWHNVSNPEEFGFAKGQVQPFWLDTSDGEKLFCWHVLPLDVYLEHENEIVDKSEGGVADGLEGTVGARFLMKDTKSRVVVNFHGNAGHVAQGWRPSTYRSVAAIPHTHLLTCDYRGFGKSSLNNPPHIPTESGLITDSISLISYILNDLKHPASRTVLLGQSLGTAVAAASALFFTDPESEQLPSDIVKPEPAVASPQHFAGVVLVAPFTTLSELLQTHKISGIIPVLSPLRPYPKIANFLSSKILDHWPTLPRLQALLSATSANKTPLRLSLLHARNDQHITFRLSESLIHGGERVKRGAFAYRKVEDAAGERSVELEVVRYGGHNELVGWSQVALAVRRAFKKKNFRVGLDVE